jgi:hypothetical protein
VSLPSILRWIDNDLNDTRPWSALLFLVPFFPVWVLSEIGVSERAEETALFAGFAVALPWLIYFFWRQAKNVGRAFKQSADYFKGTMSKDRTDG